MSVEWNEMAVMIAITPQKERRPSMVSDGRLGPAKKRYRVPGEKSNLESNITITLFGTRH